MNKRKKSDTILLELENKIQYHFSDSSLLLHALTHSSYANEMRMHKENTTSDWNSLVMLSWN